MISKSLNSVGNGTSAIDFTTMIWSHHWPEQHDRCAVVGGRLVCRRCLVLYPVAFAVVILATLGVAWPENFDSAALLLLPIPVVADFIAEQVGVIRYSARRQVVTTALGAIALGRGFGRYFDHTSDGLFWSMAGVYGGLCALAAVGRHVRERRIERSAAEAAMLNDPVAVGFSTRDEFVAYMARTADNQPSGGVIVADPAVVGNVVGDSGDSGDSGDGDSGCGVGDSGGGDDASATCSSPVSSNVTN